MRKCAFPFRMDANGVKKMNETTKVSNVYFTWPVRADGDLMPF